MSSYRLLIGTLLLAMLFVGAGCGKKTSPPPAEQPAPAAEAPIAPAEQPKVALPDNPCDNPYFPLKNGYGIDYQVKAQNMTFDYKLKVSEVSAAGAKLTFSFSAPVAFDVVQELECQSGTILTKGYLDIAGEISSRMGMKMKTETKAVRGEIMPKSLAVGQTWSAGYDTLVSYENLPPQFRNVTSSIDSVNKVVAEEDVTVPAGTFRAMKVEVETTVTTDMPGAGGPTTSTSLQWWVKDVGLIKTIVGNGSSQSTTDAVKINRL